MAAEERNILKSIRISYAGSGTGRSRKWTSLNGLFWCPVWQRTQKMLEDPVDLVVTLLTMISAVSPMLIHICYAAARGHPEYRGCHSLEAHNLWHRARLRCDTVDSPRYGFRRTPATGYIVTADDSRLEVYRKMSQKMRVTGDENPYCFSRDHSGTLMIDPDDELI
jgi:hypothetical protein